MSLHAIAESRTKFREEVSIGQILSHASYLRFQSFLTPVIG